MASEDVKQRVSGPVQEIVTGKILKIPKKQLDIELTCPVCLGILRETEVSPCMHRFCGDCIQKCLRLRFSQCPTCRVHLSSRRSLKRDRNFDDLITLVYPDLDQNSEDESSYLKTVTGGIKFAPPLNSSSKKKFAKPTPTSSSSTARLTASNSASSSSSSANAKVSLQTTTPSTRRSGAPFEHHALPDVTRKPSTSRTAPSATSARPSTSSNGSGGGTSGANAEKKSSPPKISQSSASAVVQKSSSASSKPASSSTKPSSAPVALSSKTHVSTSKPAHQPESAMRLAAEAAASFAASYATSHGGVRGRGDTKQLTGSPFNQFPRNRVSAPKQTDETVGFILRRHPLESSLPSIHDQYLETETRLSTMHLKMFLAHKFHMNNPTDIEIWYATEDYRQINLKDKSTLFDMFQEWEKGDLSGKLVLHYRSKNRALLPV